MRQDEGIIVAFFAPDLDGKRSPSPTTSMVNPSSCPGLIRKVPPSPSTRQTISLRSVEQ